MRFRSVSQLILILLAIADSAAAQQFIQAPRYLSPNCVSGVVAADFNRDGSTDLAFANDCGAVLTIQLGNGDGTFTLGQQLSNGTQNANGLAAGDWNGDGILDLATATLFPSAISVFLGNGDGTFTAGNMYDLPSNCYAIASGDLNGDGIPDLITAYDSGLSAGGVSVFLGLGAGAFAPPVTYSLSGANHGVVVADLNRDGKADVAVADYTTQGTGAIIVMLGNGDGTLQSPVQYKTVTNDESVTVADFNHDGILDLAGAGVETKVAVLLGKGDGTFQAATLNRSGGPAGALTTGDVNGDGNPDLIVTNDNSVAVLLGRADGTFQNASLFGVGPWATSLAVADFNRDGHLDIAAAEFFDSDFSILIGDGTGKFVARRDYLIATQSGQHPSVSSATAARLNNSGNTLDLVLADGPDNQIIVLPGNADGSFRGAAAFLTGSDPLWIVTADLNRDGNVDAVTANATANSISVLLGNGKDGFTAHVDYGTGNHPVFVATGDVNNDGSIDVITANQTAKNFSVLLNKGSGQFPKHVDIPIGRTPVALALGDFNGDGKLDIAVVDTGSEVDIFLGNGDGTFSAGEVFSSGQKPQAIAVGDVNSDGKLDLAVAHTLTSSVSIFLGNGDGTFSAGAEIMSGSAPTSVLLGDFNGDGKVDLIALNRYLTGAASYSGNLFLSLGDGTGGFQRAQIYNTDGSVAAAAGDFNNDGLLDVVTAGDPYVVSVFLNGGNN